MQLAGPFGAPANGVNNAGFPFSAKYLHGNYNTAIEVFFYLSFIHNSKNNFFRGYFVDRPYRIIIRYPKINSVILITGPAFEFAVIINHSSFFMSESLQPTPWYRLITIRQLLFWIFIFAITHHFMRGADHFLAMTKEALGKYFNLRWVLIAHI